MSGGIRLTIAEAASLAKARSKEVERRLKSVTAGSSLSAADVNSLKIYSVLLYDLSEIMAKSLSPDGKDSAFTVTPEMKAFFDEARRGN